MSEDIYCQMKNLPRPLNQSLAFWPKIILEARVENLQRVQRMCSTKHNLCDTYHQGSSEVSFIHLDINGLKIMSIQLALLRWRVKSFFNCSTVEGC